MAIRRILLVYGIIFTASGIPLIYLGDEIGNLNDYTYRKDPIKSSDSRWVHRLKTDGMKLERRKQKGTIENRVFEGLANLIRIRKENVLLSSGFLEVLDIENDQVLGLMRADGTKKILVLANFTEEEQIIPKRILRIYISSNCVHNLTINDRYILKEVNLEPLEIDILETS